MDELVKIACNKTKIIVTLVNLDYNESNVFIRFYD